VVVRGVDSAAPRKLVAHSERDHIRVQWFPPAGPRGVRGYRLYRADGFDAPMRLLATLDATAYLDDRDLAPDHAYYYQVAATDASGRESRPSNRDDAKARSRPRLYDAEIVEHSVPTTVAVGEQRTVTATIRNTGTRAWDLTNPERQRVWLQTCRLWGEDDESRLPQVTLLGAQVVEPGATVTVTLPYVGPREGRFENHWVLRMQSHQPGTPDKKPVNGDAWFGTPLLVETTVTK
jgi:hypothetical protein